MIPIIAADAETDVREIRQLVSTACAQAALAVTAAGIWEQPSNAVTTTAPAAMTLLIAAAIPIAVRILLRIRIAGPAAMTAPKPQVLAAKRNIAANCFIPIILNASMKVLMSTTAAAAGRLIAVIFVPPTIYQAPRSPMRHAVAAPVSP